MAGRKTFIGYDLGDGETITDLAVLDESAVRDRVQTLFNAMTMPDNNTPGQPMPTVYGLTEEGNVVFSSSILADPESIRDIHISFKRCPGDLMPSLTEARRQEIADLLKKGWPEQSICPELYSEKMRQFSQAVVDYTNALFGDESFRRSIQDAAVDSESIVFCVGHPTRWTPFDVAVYDGILRRSVLGKGNYAGKPTSMLMAAESRAAFLYVKDRATSKVLAPGTSALLIDVGSSTVDLTAMTADSRNHQYNSGSNYLGARSVDYIIQDWYLRKLRKDPEDWEVYQSLLRMNPTMEQAVTLSCRKAKEEVYSVAAKKSRILFGDFMPLRISQADVDAAIDAVPVADVLEKYISLPTHEREDMGQRTWKDLFRRFLRRRKEEMTAQGIRISRIILTGSASKMPFVSEIVSEVFDEVPPGGILNDMNPSRSISMGLTLVGPSNEISLAFQQDLNAMLEGELDTVIANDIPALADALAPILESHITSIVKRRIRFWREGYVDTLHDMTKMIEADCSGDSLTKRLTDDPAYQKAIQKWTTDVVGHDIALRLKSICDRYGVSEITLDSLNVMKVSGVRVDGISIDPTEDLLNILSYTVTLIAGLIMGAITPTVLAVVLTLISSVSMSIAVFLLEALLLIPGGIPILAGLAGLAAVRLVGSGMDSTKKLLTDKLQTAKLPEWVRNLLTDAKINDQLAKSDLKKSIRASILEEDSKKRIAASVKQSLRAQIDRCAEDIKYVIESK